MIEALVALALAAFLLATLATVTAQWLPRWKAGFGRAQNADLMGVGLDRIAADLAAAEYAGPGDGTQLLFQGTPDSVTFVRSAVGPNASAGLEIVQLAETENKRGTVLTRTRAAFVPDATRDALNDGAIEFTNPVVLVRPPYRVSFSYTGRDGRWRETWDDASQLPAAVQIAVRSAGAEQALALSTAVLLNVNAPAECARSTKPDCGPGQSKPEQVPSPVPGDGGLRSGG
jgi:general secretion pathway protein J